MTSHVKVTVIMLTQLNTVGLWPMESRVNTDPAVTHNMDCKSIPPDLRSGGAFGLRVNDTEI